MLSGGVVVKEGATVKNCVIMDDVVISENAKVYTAIIDSDSVIGKNSKIGNENAGKENVTVVGKGKRLPSETVILN